MDSLACGFQALKYPACTQAARPGRARRHACPAASRVPGTSYELDPVMARLQHRRAWCAGSTSTTPGSPPSGAIRPTTSAPSSPSPTICRAARSCCGEKPLTVRDVLDRDDQGARDPGRARAGEQLQPRRPRPRAAGAHRLDRGRHGDARRLARADRQRALERLDRRRRAAHLPPRAQHRLAQELGRRRRHQPRRAPRA